MRRQAILLIIFCSALVASSYAQTGEEWFEIGSTHFDNSSFLEAISAWEKAAEEDPSLSANAWYNIGLAYAGMEQYEQAVQSWDKTIAIAPDSPIAYDNKGTALALLGRNDEALAAYDMAIKLDPDQTKFKSDKEMLVKGLNNTKTPLSTAGVIGAVLIAGALLVYRRRI
ncbi:MAG: tetratricopeptide repeat protein [Methanospirillum sp.]|uniref:tetratricopeptide repeat protein n=1 Tax=Methanospirillum sp. TaxID=45200 RepID=UPI00236F5939|nr:tetratricopeptide repeat protein [Methanospirillum sp.]MDD1728934.1 tetratricopeptide repeat protein [Methanospirillum sp.]